MSDNINSPKWVNIPNSTYDADLFTGLIRNAKTLQVLRPALVKSSCRYYYCVRIDGVSVAVQRLVMAAALQRALLPHELVRHRDGNPTRNALANLELGTARSNMADRYRDNTAGVKLRNAHVHEIRALGRRASVRSIAERYGVSRSHVRSILSGRRWGGLR